MNRWQACLELRTCCGPRSVMSYRREAPLSGISGPSLSDPTFLYLLPAGLVSPQWCSEFQVSLGCFWPLPLMFHSEYI